MIRKYQEILNVRVDSTSKDLVLAWVEKRVTEKKKSLIVTPNPEIVLQAQKDRDLRLILNKAEMALADGVGLVYAAKFLGLPGPREVVRGREIFINLCEIASKKGWRIFLLGGRRGVSQKAKENLLQKFPRLKIEEYYGPSLDKNGNPTAKEDKKLEEIAIDKINNFKTDLLFVGFGCPKQEKWLYRNWYRLNIKVGMVVGGAFDYTGGTSKLPPKWLANLGFEWLWRLICEPRRAKRIISATVLFPIKIVLEKIKNFNFINSVGKTN